MGRHESVADRLLVEARARTARAESPTRGRVALAVGVLALIVSPVPVLGGVLGATAFGLGASAVRRPRGAEQARIAVALGGAAILVGVLLSVLDLAPR